MGKIAVVCEGVVAAVVIAFAVVVVGVASGGEE